MANIIKPKRRSASSAAPTTAQLQDGEIAVNSFSRTIYLRVASNVVAIANYFSGSYNDLTDKPAIPDASEFTPLHSQNPAGTGDANAPIAGFRGYLLVDPAPNTPTNSWTSVIQHLNHDSSWGFQLSKPWFDNELYIRPRHNGAWGDYHRIWHSGNFAPANKQDALGFTPIRQGGGIGQYDNTISIGWDGGSTKITVDGYDQGAIAMSPWVNNTFAKYGSDVSFRDISVDRGNGTGALFFGPMQTSTYLYYNGSSFMFGLPSGEHVAWHSGNFSPASKIDVGGNAVVNILNAGPAPTTTSGVNIHWNLASPGHGRAEIVNNRGGGSGGISFYDRLTTSDAPKEIAHIASDGGFYTKAYQNPTMVRMPRIFVQPGDPGAFAQDGDVWMW